MKRKLTLAFTLICLMLGTLCARAAEVTPELSIFIKIEKKEVYENEPFSAVITLRSSTPDIAFVKKGEEGLKLKKGQFATFQLIEPAGEPYEETKGGRTWYCFPLDAFMLTLDSKGKFELTAGEYQIGVFFYGIATNQLGQRVKSRKVRQFNVPVEKQQIKVLATPAPPHAMNYSGSVGQFSIETVVPPGDIYINEEATAYIILRGSGMIAEQTLPEYQDAFRNCVRLKSVSESRDEGHINGKMMSELRLECIFIPTDRDCAEIGESRFAYFDPETGKYATACSKPVKVQVKSSTAKRENIAV